MVLGYEEAKMPIIDTDRFIIQSQLQMILQKQQKTHNPPTVWLHKAGRTHDITIMF